jgi:hypothetical protein
VWPLDGEGLSRTHTGRCCSSFSRPRPAGYSRLRPQRGAVLRLRFSREIVNGQLSKQTDRSTENLDLAFLPNTESKQCLAANDARNQHTLFFILVGGSAVGFFEVVVAHDAQELLDQCLTRDAAATQIVELTVGAPGQ